MPNVLAVDFGEKGDLVPYTKDLDADLRQLSHALDEVSTTTTPGGTTTTTTTTSTTTTTTVAPATTVPAEQKPSVVVTDLSGGDPAKFCAAYNPGIASVVAWALASISSPQGQQGQVDLAYASVLDRDFGALAAVAPTKLAELAAPFNERVARAMAELRKLGLSEQRIARLAEQVSEQLTSPDSPDPATIELGVLNDLRAELGDQVGDRRRWAAHGGRRRRRRARAGRLRHRAARHRQRRPGTAA